MRNNAHIQQDCSFEREMTIDVANDPSLPEKVLVRNSAFRKNPTTNKLIQPNIGIIACQEICLDLLFRGI